MSSLAFKVAAAFFVAGLLASIWGRLGNKGDGPSYHAHGERWGFIGVALVVVALVVMLVGGILGRPA